MPHEFALAQYEPDARTANQDQAYVERGNALGGVGITATLVEQFPVKRHLKLAPPHGYQQAIALALAEVSLRPAQAQAQLTLGQ